MNWKIISSIKQHLKEETGTQIFPPGQRLPVAFIYPNEYKLGMSNLGLHILYQVLNGAGYACERFFLPERALMKEYERSRTPLLSYETQRALMEFPYICAMMSFELDYQNLLTMLHMSHVKLRAADRNDKEPVVILGGPCATFNPEPLAPIADCFVIGEGEETLPRLLAALEAARERGASREERLLAAAQTPGVYVPRFYVPEYAEPCKIKSGKVKNAFAAEKIFLRRGEKEKYSWPEQVALRADPRVPPRVKRQWIRDIDAYPHASAIVTRGTEFSNMYIVETARGCGRHCRFCMAGYCFRKPRNRDLEKLWSDIEKRPPVTEKVGLMGAAVSDFPQMHELTRRLTESNVTFSVASLRADMLDEPLVQALARSGQRTMTVAPEAGSVKLRAAINKGITAEHVYNAMQLAARAGMHSVKLYYMLGLPGEDEQDMQDLFDMLHKVRSDMLAMHYRGELICSVNAFVPKPFTPYQWSALLCARELKKRFRALENEFRADRKVKIITESLRDTEVQATLARGSRLMGAALIEAEERGVSFKEALARQGIDLQQYAHRGFAVGDFLPWQHIDTGVTDAYMRSELERSKRGEFTPRCADGCKRCGVCR